MLRKKKVPGKLFGTDQVTLEIILSIFYDDPDRQVSHHFIQRIYTITRF
jgi:hypothetical protein